MHSRLVPLGLVALITAATLVGAARADVGGNVSGSGLGPVFEYGSLNMFPRGFVTAMVFGPDASACARAPSTRSTAAEVIVPNASLTSSQIVNWTLSDRMRRVDLPVGVAYGTDPSRVIALLEGLARKHPDVLEAPEPQALFMGFGESSLDFQLRSWTNRVDQTFSFRSELAVAVNAALTEAGITGAVSAARRARADPDSVRRPPPGRPR